MPAPGFDSIVNTIARRFGLAMQLVDTGGGYTVLEGRLESDAWLWISDLDAGLTSLDRRAELENQGLHIGWRLQVYPHSPADAGPDLNTVLSSVAHASGTVADLGDLIDQVLGGLPSNAHVVVEVDGSTSVEHGVRCS